MKDFIFDLVKGKEKTKLVKEYPAICDGIKINLSPTSIGNMKYLKGLFQDF